MATLKEAGLVLDRRDAQWVRYRLNPNMSAAIGAVVKSVMAANRLEKQPRPVRSAARRLRERVTA
jgi:ArsR family transcriptional regulator